MRDLPKAAPRMGAAWHCLLFGPPTASREGVLSSRLFFYLPVVVVAPSAMATHPQSSSKRPQLELLLKFAYGRVKTAEMEGLFK